MFAMTRAALHRRSVLFNYAGLFLRLHRVGVDGGDAAVAGRSAGSGRHQVR